MDETKLRHLERQYKLRVKTGCETCRIRKIKCDESKPACLRCTKTGRTCDGYKSANTANKGVTAASHRNSAFLVMPRKPTQTTMIRSPSWNLSPNSVENRSFEYFRTRTLPMWTEFFDSEIWSRTILQLSHAEPAIKHGVLALSTMHERYDSMAPISTSSTNDFAFVQYTQAIKHSNELLIAHQKGIVSLEMVLMACIIFTCYENLAGNYHTASMHLRNGLRLLEQKKDLQSSTSRNDIANVLYRFDLQAMTFSDNASRYDYVLTLAPSCPSIQTEYKSNDTARDDLVNLLRCMMWLAGMAEEDSLVATHPTWLSLHQGTMSAFRQWEATFAAYLAQLPVHEQRDPKVYAGNTLLKISAITFHIVMSSGAGVKSEMAWDLYVEDFRRIVDLAETIPLIRPTSMRTATSSSPSGSPAPLRLLAPNPATVTPSSASTSSTFNVFPYYSSSSASPSPKSPRDPTILPSSFSPSFELSSIVPLFIVGARCRDPIIRRRAISLLLSSRRREGVWDSLGAGMVALQCMTKEEGLPPHLSLHGDVLARNPEIRTCSDVEEKNRVNDIFVAVKVQLGRVDLVYSLTTGEERRERHVIWESRGDGVGQLGGHFERGRA